MKLLIYPCICAALYFTTISQCIAQFSQKREPPIRTMLVTAPTEWGISKGNIGIQFQPSVGWGKYISLGVHGLYSSKTTDIQEDIIRNSYNSLLEVQLRFFPWGTHRNLKRNPKPVGCYSFSAPPFTDPFAGLYVQLSHSWEEYNLQYDLPLNHPSDKSSITYQVEARLVSIQTGYQIHIWHFTVGAGYRVSMRKATWYGDGPNILSVPESYNLLHEAKIEIGINF